MKIKNRSKFSIAFALKFFLFLGFANSSITLFAQAVSARLVGAVQDTTKLGIAGATVEARDVDTGLTLHAETDSAGEYTFPHISPGRYTVTATASGFNVVEVKDLTLQIGDAKTLDIQLAPGAVSQAVEVTESTPTVDTGSTQVGAVVENRQAVDLPLNGREAMTLFYLQAGTNPLDNQVVPGSQQQIGGVDGLPPGTSETRIEGILAINSSFDYSPAHPSFPVPQEAVDQYKVGTSGNGSDDGPASGAEVRVLVKSGTNHFHGTVFEFIRNTAFDANQFFNKGLNGNTQQALLHRNQFGFSFGGPIWKNKTFFFGTGEWQRQTQNNAEEATVYTNPLRQGTFRYNTTGKANSTSMVNPQDGTPTVAYSSYTLANSGQFDTVYLPYVLGVMPSPNSWDKGDGFNTAGYRYQSHDLDNYYQALVKIEQVLNPHNNLSLTLAQYNENAPESKYFNGVVMEGYTEQRRGLSLRLVSTLTQTWMNELSIGGARRFAQRPNTTTSCETPTGNITLTGLGTLCDNRSTQRNPAVNEGFQDVSTKVIGHHTIEAGVEYWYETLNRLSGTRYPLINTSNSVNPATVPALTNLNSTDRGDAEQWQKDLTGGVGNITQNFYISPQGTYTQYAPLTEQLRKNEWGLFVHDAWRLTPRININVGLRWDILPAVKNKDGYAYPVGGLNGMLGVQGPTGAPTSFAFAPNFGGSIYSTDFHAFAPSIGVIWDPFGDGKSAVRASYHLSNVRTEMISGDLSTAENGSATSVTIQPAITLSQLNTVLPIPLPTPFQAQPNTRQGAAIAAEPNLAIPYVQEWTFGLDREVYNGWRLSATYVGNHAVGMWRSADLNQVEIRSNGFLNAFSIAQKNLAANGSPTVGQSLGDLQALFAEVPSGEYNVITQGQAATLANYLDTSGSTRGVLVSNAGLPATFFRYNPQFQDIYILNNYGSSTWNAAKIELKRKFEHGVYLQANYTLGKGFVDYPQDEQNYATSAQGTTTPFRDNANHRLDRTISPLDATHVFLVNGLYELPFGQGRNFLSNGNKILDAFFGGWQVNGIFSHTTGRPIPVTTGYNLLNQNVTTNPNFNRAFTNFSRVNKSITPGGRTVSYATTAQLADFTTPTPGTEGNFAIQGLHGPSYTNLDASLFKSFKLHWLGPKGSIQFRTEWFNVLNHPNFKSPTSLNLNTPSSANLTNTYAARIGQFAAKIIF